MGSSKNSVNPPSVSSDKLPTSEKARSSGTVRQASSMEEDFLEFQLDKTHAALVQAGEHIASSYVYSIMFLALTAALSLGNLEVEDRITLPVIDLALSRWHAAGISLILTGIFFYSLITMKATERLLTLKLDDLIARRFGHEGYHWHLFFPSVFTSGENLGYISVFGTVAHVVPGLGTAGITVAVPYLAYVIGSQLGWSGTSMVMTGVALLILVIAICTLIAMPHATARRQDILDRIEN